MTASGPIFDVEAKRAHAATLRDLTSAPDLWEDQDRARKLMGELARLDDDLGLYDGFVARLDDLSVLDELAVAEGDEASSKEVQSGIAALQKELGALEERTLLGGEYADTDAIVTVHPGAGGTESQDWAEMLLRMYLRWAENRGMGVEILEWQVGEEAGIKSATFTVKGRFAFGLVSTERGVHRLVRISPYDANKRRHTSFASVDIVPMLEEDVNVEINSDDLRVDVFRSSGAGGQHVNTTDSAVRITHLPTGMVVSCQSERSQTQNKASAMRVLQARLAELMRQEHVAKLEELRGEHRAVAFGSQIRSYVLHPYQMVKDHRTGHESSNTSAVLDGDIDAFIRTTLEWQRAGGTASN